MPRRLSLDEAYESGRYWKVIDYTRPLPLSFAEADAQFVTDTARRATQSRSAS